MRRATENHGNFGKLAEYKKNTISKKNKVKDLGGQQCSIYFTSFHQETPMKPSQVPNRLSPPLSRKLLPHSRPELCCKERQSTQRHPTHSSGPVTSRGRIPSSPSGSSVNSLHSKPKDRLSSPKHSVKPPGLTSSGPNHILNSSNNPYAMSRDRVGPVQSVPGVVPVSPINGDSPSMPQPSHPHLLHPASPQFVRKSKNDSQSCHVGGDQVPESKASSSNSGTKNDSAPGEDSDEYQQRECKTSNVITAMEVDGSSHKNCLDSATLHENGKRTCLQSPNSGETQNAKPTAEGPQGNSLDPQRYSLCLEQAVKARDSPLQSDAREQLTCSDTSSPTKHKQSHDMSSPKHHTHMPPAMGAKQTLLQSTQTRVLLSSPPKPSEDGVKKRIGVHNKTDKSHSSLTPQLPRKDSSCSTYNHHSGQITNTSLAFAVKPVNRSNQTVERMKPDGNHLKPTSKLTSVSANGPTVEKSNAPRARKHAVILDDVDQLFTPDPLTYVVGLPRKTPKSKIDEVPHKTPTSEKDALSRAAPSSSAPAAGPSCHKTQNAASSAVSLHTSTQPPTSKRLKLDAVSPTSSKPESGSVTPSGVQLKQKSVKVEKATLPLSNSASLRISLDTAASERTPPPGSQRPLLERQASEKSRAPVSEDDLDLDLSFALDVNMTESSHSSEEEHLISFQEMIERATKPPDTPEKGAFSEPSTPGHHNSQTKNKLLPSTTKPVNYKNNLDDMLKDININKRAKEIELEHLTACKTDLLRIAEYEKAEESHAARISTEEQEFLQRYSLMSNAIKEIPPGEVVFNMEKVGRIFDQHTLQLRHCMVHPQGTAQKTILWSSPDHLRLHVAIELFQKAYDSHSPCPSPVTRFLFKMMSIHSERFVSDGMLQALFDIAYTAADERVNNGSHQFRVWVPSLADVTLILLNMGASFVTLFPSENLQPLFTEGDLLEDVYVKQESVSDRERNTFAEHNYNNVLKYLSFSLGLCPRAYSDDELVLLLTVVSRISLDPQLILLSSLSLYSVHHRIVNNFTDWDKMLPKICAALTDLTDDHHNMCHLVHLLPNSKRGKQLRQHLSMSMISKLIEGNCTYRPTQSNFQLSVLRRYLLRMKPSILLRNMLNSGGRHRNEENNLDQQAYYLCYSLLTLVKEASNLLFFTAEQKAQLLCLSSELETHVKCDIRESEKCLYRSKVKDLVARIYTRWQILLQRTKPLNNKLYNYWEPVDALISRQEDEEITVMEVDEDTPTGERVEEMENETMKPDEDVNVGEELVGMEGNLITNDTSKTEEATEPESRQLKASSLSHGELNTQQASAHDGATRS